jgi:predicted amidophosphoribosyltransferase
MSKKVLRDCIRCGAPVYEEKAHVCSKCSKELAEMHEKAEKFYADEYAAEIGGLKVASV